MKLEHLSTLLNLFIITLILFFIYKCYILNIKHMSIDYTTYYNYYSYKDFIQNHHNKTHYKIDNIWYAINEILYIEKFNLNNSESLDKLIINHIKISKQVTFYDNIDILEKAYFNEISTINKHKSLLNNIKGIRDYINQNKIK